MFFRSFVQIFFFFCYRVRMFSCRWSNVAICLIELCVCDARNCPLSSNPYAYMYIFFFIVVVVPRRRIFFPQSLIPKIVSNKSKNYNLSHLWSIFHQRLFSYFFILIFVPRIPRCPSGLYSSLLKRWLQNWSHVNSRDLK